MLPSPNVRTVSINYGGLSDLPSSVGLKNIYKYDYETDELPNPRPTQPKKKIVEKRRLGAPLFPTAK